MSPIRSSRIAVAGPTIWHQTRTADGLFTERLAGAAMTAAILAEWDVSVSLVSVVGDDVAGERARSALAAAGVDLAHLATRRGGSTSRVLDAFDDAGVETPVEVRQGPRLARGDRLDIYDIFSHDLVLLDLDDFALRQFLVDLPAHTVPNTRLLGTLIGLSNAPEPERLRVVLAHDAIVASEPEFLALTRAVTLNEGVTQFQQEMRISNLRTAILLRPNGTTILTPAARSDLDSSVGLPLAASARAAYLAGVAHGMVHRRAWDQVVPFAAMVATFMRSGQSSRANIPSPAQVSQRLNFDPTTLNS